MTSARKLRERPQLPKALVCGLLEDEGRVLFLKQKDRHGTERLELPHIFNYGGDMISQLAEAFLKQTGIDAEAGDVVRESRHNAGSRRKRRWIPCLAIRMSAKSKRANPPEPYSGFKWLSLENAKKERLGRSTEWIRGLE